MRVELPVVPPPQSSRSKTATLNPRSAASRAMPGAVDAAANDREVVLHLLALEGKLVREVGEERVRVVCVEQPDGNRDAKHELLVTGVYRGAKTRREQQLLAESNSLRGRQTSSMQMNEWPAR
jgi:hypothetical protein